MRQNDGPDLQSEGYLVNLKPGWVIPVAKSKSKSLARLHHRGHCCHSVDGRLAWPLNYGAELFLSMYSFSIRGELFVIANLAASRQTHVGCSRNSCACRVCVGMFCHFENA